MVKSEINIENQTNYRGELFPNTTKIMEESFIIETFRNIFRKILYSSLGESAGEALLFILRMELGRDLVEAFWEDPRVVYQTMEKILGIGTKVLIDILVTRIRQDYGLNIESEYVLDLMRRGDQSSTRGMRFLLRKIVESYVERGMLS